MRSAWFRERLAPGPSSRYSDCCLIGGARGAREAHTYRNKLAGAIHFVALRPPVLAASRRSRPPFPFLRSLLNFRCRLILARQQQRIHHHHPLPALRSQSLANTHQQSPTRAVAPGVYKTLRLPLASSPLPTALQLAVAIKDGHDVPYEHSYPFHCFPSTSFQSRLEERRRKNRIGGDGEGWRRVEELEAISDRSTSRAR
jgi:hypothetical protein